MGFRDNLKQELNLSGMLVKELAAASGVQKRALDTYLLSENASMPPADIAVKIAHELGVSVEYLVTGEEAILPADIRYIVRNLLQLNKKDRKVVAALTNALLERGSA
ncbi:MAG: helix-turn-helix domain-containing protein [Treponema sp.]|nr:helix-turn-helix domain-containing protein [Treponema sp.]